MKTALSVSLCVLLLCSLASSQAPSLPNAYNYTTYSQMWAEGGESKIWVQGNNCRSDTFIQGKPGYLYTQHNVVHNGFKYNWIDSNVTGESSTCVYSNSSAIYDITCNYVLHGTMDVDGGSAIVGGQKTQVWISLKDSAVLYWTVNDPIVPVALTYDYYITPMKIVNFQSGDQPSQIFTDDIPDDCIRCDACLI